MTRFELVEPLITGDWPKPTTRRRKVPTFTPAPVEGFSHFVGTDDQGAGYFIVLDESGEASALDTATFRQVLLDAKKAQVLPPFRVYARYELLQSPNVLFTKFLHGKRSLV